MRKAAGELKRTNTARLYPATRERDHPVMNVFRDTASDQQHGTNGAREQLGGFRTVALAPSVADGWQMIYLFLLNSLQNHQLVGTLKPGINLIQTQQTKSIKPDMQFNPKTKG